MSVAPPPPPPPPPPCDRDSPANTLKDFDTNSSTIIYADVCEWATNEPQLWEACTKYNICLHKTPYRHKYQHFEQILQVGPTCGLVALAMVVNGEVTAEEMLNICKLEGYSCNGEMFSCKNMVKLMNKVLSLAEIENVRCSMRLGGLYSDETIERLLSGAVLLVPYDADCNHSPCCRKGHTAHWALVCGVAIADDPGISYTSDARNVHVFCRHGKSRYLAVWSLEQLDKSNKNLWEFSPKKRADDLIYVLPEGGIGGENGLRDQYLIIEGL